MGTKTSMHEEGPGMPQAGLIMRSETMADTNRLDAARAHLGALLREMCDAPGWRMGTPWWTDRLQAARMARKEVDHLEFLAATRTIRGASRR